MVLNGKEATCLMLHCPLRCGGYIDHDVLMSLMEDNSLFVYGKCSECGHAGDITLSLEELMTKCPLTTTAVM